MEVGGEIHATAALTLGKELPLPTEQGTGWVPQLVWTFLREQSLVPARNQTSNFKVHSLVAILTNLHQLEN